MVRRYFADRVKQPRTKLIATLAVLGFAALLAVLDLPCPILYFTGIPCPGCGMTRALIGAAQLRFAYAFQMHAMFWSVPVLYLYFLCDGRLFGRRTVNAAVIIVIASGFLLNWIRHFV